MFSSVFMSLSNHPSSLNMQISSEYSSSAHSMILDTLGHLGPFPFPFPFPLPFPFPFPFPFPALVATPFLQASIAVIALSPKAVPLRHFIFVSSGEKQSPLLLPGFPPFPFLASAESKNEEQTKTMRTQNVFMLIVQIW